MFIIAGLSFCSVELVFCATATVTVAVAAAAAAAAQKNIFMH